VLAAEPQKSTTRNSAQAALMVFGPAFAAQGVDASVVRDLILG